MPLANFLHPCMQSATVSASCLAADDHSAHNLLAAPQSAQHSRGFVSYSVVRPPIHLDFRLHSPIQLHRLLIWTQVGSLRTTSLEVSVREESAQPRDFIRVGVLNDLPATCSGVVFRNVRLNGAADAEPEDQRTASLLAAEFFRCLHPRMAVRAVRIGIRQTHQRCAAALREVQIVGQPAAWCLPAAECQRLMSLWAARPQPVGFYGAAAQVTDAAEGQAAAQPLSAPAGDEPPIPEAFLDDITCHLMQLPMTLPSGKCVDRSTLERLELSAASWAQQASDPFTGLPFTATRRPVLNAALKAQIDRYLVRHQDRADVREVPRTVGFGSGAAADRKRCGWGEPMAAAKRPRRDGGGAAAETEEEEARVAASCGDCGAGQAALLYRLQTCEHFMCRSCLVDKGRQKCGRCERRFERTDVRRYYDVELG